MLKAFAVEPVARNLMPLRGDARSQTT
jgi:hypothetical protein